MYRTNPAASFVRVFNKLTVLCNLPENFYLEKIRGDMQETARKAINTFLKKQVVTEIDYSVMAQLSLCEDMEIFLELVNAFLVKFEQSKLPGHLAIINLANLFASSFFRTLPQENFKKIH